MPVVSLTLLGNYTGSQFAVSYDGFGSTVTLACFAAGTRIATHRGLVAVEALHQGDLIYTAQEEDFRPVVWIGHREVDCASHPEPWKVWPVRIQAGGFGPGMPLRDLYLSPDHAVFASGVLIPIKHLINGTSIAQIAVDRVTYYHVELERHGVLMAEGLPTESLLKGGDRSNFSNSDGPVRLFADFSGAAAAVLDWEAFGCAPLLIAGPEVDAVRHHLAVRMTKSPTLRRRSHRRKPGVAA